VNDVPDTGQFLADSVWVLRVGPRVATVGDFVREWFNSYPEYRPGQDSAGRVTFLKSLLTRDVLALTALGQNRPLSFEDRIAVREARQRALTTAVHVRFVDDSVHVSDADVRNLYEFYQWKQHLRHIVFEDRLTAERVRRDLIGGRIPWAAAAAKYSIAKNDSGPAGDVGWVGTERLAPELILGAYGLRPGEISQPINDKDGWELIQSVERKPASPPGFAALQRVLRQYLADSRSSARTERLTALLRLRRGVVYDTTAARFASAHFKETMKFEPNGLGTTLNINGDTPEFTSDDTARAIARWKGGRFSIGDLVHAVSDIPPVMRPNLTLWESVIAFVESIVLEPDIAEYGAERGLEKDLLVTEAIRRKTEELMVDHLYQDSIGTKVWVSKDERKAYYAQNLKGFFTYPSVEFAAIVRSSKASADSLEKALQAGAKARAILHADSLGGLVSGSVQVHQQNEQFAYKKALFEELRPGGTQVRGPDRLGDYVVLQLLSYDAGRQLSYDEVEQTIDESLQNQKSEAALAEMVERLKKRYPIDWRPELVMQIKLVDPTL
jgi:parvulin-like peptidyl-prolyl isomerase